MNRVIRLLGLSLVTLVAGFYLFILMVGAVEGAQENLDFESLGMIILGLLTVASAVVAWLKMPIGGWVAVVVGVIFAIFAFFSAGHNRWLAVLVSGLPLAVGGGLMLISLREKGKS